MNKKGFAVCLYLSPGESHRGGSHHQQGPLIPVVGCDADGLYGLSQAHVISQEEAALFRHCKTIPEILKSVEDTQIL